MIVFRHQPTYIRVMRLHDDDTTDNLGKIFRCGVMGRWMWDGCYRDMQATDNWDCFDKRAIIGLLDNLNGIPYRPINELLDQWNKIMCV